MNAKTPSTKAIRMLRKAGAAFQIHRYQYLEHGGAQVAADALGISPHSVVKTIVLEDEGERPLLMLMHGDMQISTKKLARALGVKRVSPCAPEVAERATGYRVGGTSPLGVRTPMPVYVEESVLALETIYINGGSRGLLLELKTSALLDLLRPETIQARIPLRNSSDEANAC